MQINRDKFNELLTDVATARQKAIKGYSFTNDHAFVPEIGATYEVNFGHVTIEGQSGFASATVRTEGPNPAQWIEVDSGEPLPAALHAFVVQAYKRVG
jgi:hypothetical protein